MQKGVPAAVAFSLIITAILFNDYVIIHPEALRAALQPIFSVAIYSAKDVSDTRGAEETALASRALLPSTSTSWLTADFSNVPTVDASGTPSTAATSTATSTKAVFGKLPKVRLHKTPIFKTGAAAAAGASSNGTSSASAGTHAATHPPVVASHPQVTTLTPSTSTAPVPTTAQAFLDATTFFLKENPDGPFEVRFATNVGTQTLGWGLDVTSVGGTGGVPAFGMTYACDPMPADPVPGALDQNPTFGVRVTSNCTITLQPSTGPDMRAVSKTFTLSTGPGQFIVTAPRTMNTVLHSNENDGGFTFNNEDTQPVTITNLTVDVSYTALNLGAGPVVLRFIDPVSGVTAGDYHLENFPASPSDQFTHTQTGMQIPITVVVNGGSEKMLPVQILGVHPMSISENPTVSVTLDSFVSNKSGGRTVFNPVLIKWSCVAAIGSYDPNATSGPFADGTACQ